jgi:hypothetical protein
MEKIVLVCGTLFFLSFLLFGCVQQTPAQTTTTQSISVEEQAKQACISLCVQEKARGTSLENGPCLSNSVAAGWVCDVAHDPREAVDNDAANQCPEFGKSAFSFVEVDTECNFIKSHEG